MTTSGEISWPSVGIFPWPPTARGHAGNPRLNKRWRTLTERGKNPLVANVAIPRELAGWCWSLATMQ
jgi:hypothetical protein